MFFTVMNGICRFKETKLTKTGKKCFASSYCLYNVVVHAVILMSQIYQYR